MGSAAEGQCAINGLFIFKDLNAFSQHSHCLAYVLNIEIKFSNSGRENMERSKYSSEANVTLHLFQDHSGHQNSAYWEISKLSARA